MGAAAWRQRRLQQSPHHTPAPPLLPGWFKQLGPAAMQCTKMALNGCAARAATPLARPAGLRAALPIRAAARVVAVAAPAEELLGKQAAQQEQAYEVSGWGRTPRRGTGPHVVRRAPARRLGRQPPQCMVQGPAAAARLPRPAAAAAAAPLGGARPRA